jgi:hypothetical protein
MDIYEIILNMTNEIKNNKMVLYSIIVMIAIYSALLNKNMSPYIRSIFSNKLVKLIIFIMISYIASENISLSIILLIMTLIILQMITYQEILEEINRKENFKSEYLTEPILRENELKSIGFEKEKIFKINEPINESKKDIEEGNKKLDESLSIMEDQIKRYDEREQNIINTNNFEALKLIQNGINRSYVSNDGEYMNAEKEKIDMKIRKIKIMENNGYIKYIKIIDFDNKYYGILNNLYNELSKKYNILLKKINEDISEKDFWREYNEYKMEEYKLVKYIITLKMNNKIYNKEEIDEIKLLIEETENIIKLDDKNKFYELLNNLIKLII